MARAQLSRAYAQLFTACGRNSLMGITSTSTNQHINMTKYLFRILMGAIALVAVALPLNAAQLTEQDKQFLAAYDKVHHALAADDLHSAKSAAGELGSDGTELRKSTSLKDARAAFEELSAKAKQLAAGQGVYHVYHCPMLNKDWVQTSTKVANPYGGKEMVACGEPKK